MARKRALQGEVEAQRATLQRTQENLSQVEDLLKEHEAAPSPLSHT